MKLRIIGIIVFLLGVQHFLFAQVGTLQTDSIQGKRYDFDKQSENSESIIVKKTKKHSPKRASIYEAIVPGLGHIYNKKYWHVPITYTAFGIATFFIIDNGKKYKKYRDAYADFSQYLRFLKQEPQFPLPIPEPTSQRFRKVLDIDYLRLDDKQLESIQRAFKNNKDGFRRYRDISYISFVAVYILNVLWANVDAHFFDYDVSEDLSLHIQPNLIITEQYRQGLGVNLVLKF